MVPGAAESWNTVQHRGIIAPVARWCARDRFPPGKIGWARWLTWKTQFGLQVLNQSPPAVERKPSAMTAILGISALYHDSAAALVVDGEIIAAAQEERFSRVKNDRRFPTSAIRYCLQEADVDPAKLDFVAFYEKPLLKFDRVLETSCAVAPRGFRSFSRSIPSWLKQKLHVTREVQRNLPLHQARVVRRAP
jgi:hypothetical protein